MERRFQNYFAIYVIFFMFNNMLWDKGILSLGMIW